MLNFQQKEKILKKYLEILKTCSLFFGVDSESLVRMLSCLGARVMSFEKRFTVFSDGSRAKYIGIVLSGRVRTSYTDFYGNRSIISESGVGELFAEEFACADVSTLPVSVEAAEESEVMLIDCSHILHTCQNSCSHHQRLIYNLMRSLAEKTIAYHRRIEITSKRTTRDKLLAYLNIESKLRSSESFEIGFDRQELADYLEVDRSGLSSEIGKLKREGIIDNFKNKFVLKEY